jgi:3-methyladenine DNA glycosylase AlkD
MKEAQIILDLLKSMRNETNIAGMKRFGIESKNILGISMQELENMKKQIGKNHDLALELWASEIHEARILAAMVAEPSLATIELMSSWANDFDNWAVCDSVCNKYFRKGPYILYAINIWVQSDKLYVKRAAFASIAVIAVHMKKLSDDDFKQYYQMILDNCTDERKHIAKAVNWALRQIGKRNARLCDESIEIADLIIKQNPQNKTALWIAKDAIRELEKKTLKD